MSARRPRPSPALLAILLALAAASPSPAGSEFQVVTTFSAGAEGWVGPAGIGGGTTLENEGGNPTHNLRTVFNDFGITFSNESNAAFIRDLTAYQAVAIALDLKVEDISFFGSPVSRNWLVELRDYDDPEKGFPYTSVWYVFAEVSQALVPDWRRFTVVIADPAATGLPGGWGGYGAEDEIGNPILPPDRTFASVLAGYDEIAFTTLQPGFVFGFTDHTVRIDNLTLASAIFGDSFESNSLDAWSSDSP